MYVFEEMIEGKKLTEIINTTHENVKYLPGHKLPENVVSTAIEIIVMAVESYLNKSAIDKKFKHQSQDLECMPTVSLLPKSFVN